MNNEDSAILNSLTDEDLMLLYQETEAKIAYYNAQQQSRKIGINSLYGSLGSRFMRWFDPRLAESITLTGQAAVQWVTNYINKYLNHVCKTTGIDFCIYNDTDSAYLELDKLVLIKGWDKLTNEEIAEHINQFCKTDLNNVIKKAFADFIEYLNHRTPVLDMARENIASRGIWTDAKKRYCMLVYDSEGIKYNPPKPKIQGLEAVKNSTPRFVRKILKDAIMIMLSKEETDLQRYVATEEEKFKKLPFEDITYNKNCNNLAKYSSKETIFTKGCPINVRAALTYNHMLKKAELDSRYPSINEGDKIKFCFLNLPNPSNSNVIAAPYDLPVELGLDDYIDYRTIFEKAFIAPLGALTTAVGWTVEKVPDLSDMFEY